MSNNPPSPTVVLSSVTRNDMTRSSMINPITPIVTLPSARNVNQSIPSLVTLKPVTPPIKTAGVPVITSVSPYFDKTIKTVRFSPNGTIKPSIKPTSVSFNGQDFSQTSVIIPPSSTIMSGSPMSVTPPVSAQLTTPLTFKPSNLTSSIPDKIILRSPNINQSITSVIDVPMTSSLPREKPIEDLLADKGFIVTDKIFLSNEYGKVSVKYLKATTDLGQTAFIELDKSGEVRYQPDSRTMIQEDVASMVPQSKITGAYECSMQGGGCGIAYDCHDEICVMTRPADSVDSPSTVVLKVASSPTSKELVLSGVPTAYPVVRFSDAYENPLVTKASIEISTKAIRNAGVQECRQYYDDTRKALAEVNNALTANYQAANKYTKTLAQETNVLQQYRATYVSRSPISEDEKNKSEEVVHRLHTRGEQVIELFKLCEALPSITVRLRELTNEITEMTKTINVNAGTVVPTNSPK